MGHKSTHVATDKFSSDWDPMNVNDPKNEEEILKDEENIPYNMLEEDLLDSDSDVSNCFSGESKKENEGSNNKKTTLGALGFGEF